MTTTTVTVPVPTIHWLLYPLLIGGVLFGFWLWHDTAIKDQVAIKAMAAAQVAQAHTDKQATTTITDAQSTLETQNATLQKQLAAARTAQAQLTLINQQLGTHYQINQPQAENPSIGTPPSSPVVEVPTTDLQVIASQVVDFKEAQNQVAADTLTIGAQKEQISSRDLVIKDQTVEITALKGGSHWKRFLAATKHVAIGVGVGVAVGYALHK